MMSREGLGDEDSTGEFKPVSPRRCQELLESQSIGRVAWQAADGPQILPVTYACHD
jgi:nitroimidazol reductase NimA-like FMN-containing flavoprotein (pyridoxamine 5'-phosphate oxidase superfamily)